MEATNFQFESDDDSSGIYKETVLLTIVTRSDCGVFVS
jgi:hypothetical protein